MRYNIVRRGRYAQIQEQVPSRLALALEKALRYEYDHKEKSKSLYYPEQRAFPYGLLNRAKRVFASWRKYSDYQDEFMYSGQKYFKSAALNGIEQMNDMQRQAVIALFNNNEGGIFAISTHIQIFDLVKIIVKNLRFRIAKILVANMAQLQVWQAYIQEHFSDIEIHADTYMRDINNKEVKRNEDIIIACDLHLINHLTVYNVGMRYHQANMIGITSNPYPKTIDQMLIQAPFGHVIYEYSITQGAENKELQKPIVHITQADISNIEFEDYESYNVIFQDALINNFAQYKKIIDTALEIDDNRIMIVMENDEHALLLAKIMKKDKRSISAGIITTQTIQSEEAIIRERYRLCKYHIMILSRERWQDMSSCGAKHLILGNSATAIKQLYDIGKMLRSEPIDIYDYSFPIKHLADKYVERLALYEQEQFEIVTTKKIQSD